MQITIKLRLRDKHAAELNRQARAVNYVWNYCNEAQRHVLRWDRWLSKYDLQRLTAGTSKELDIHAHTIQQVCHAYARARQTHKKPWLCWRGRKSLGWVPFNQGHVSFDGKAFAFRGIHYDTMHLRDILKDGIKFCAGSFNQDSRGRWYINCPIEVAEATEARNVQVGIDLGLKDFAALSNGKKIEIPQFYRKSEIRLGTLQRARKTKGVRAIHAKVASRRKDFLHKESTKIVKEYGLIIIGDVSSSKLTQTKMAKSVLDAGWSSFKQMLSYKALMHGGAMFEVSEAYSSQTCSHCGIIPQGRPKGIAGLGIRVFSCEWGASLDRDVNAARNILRVGLHTLAGGAHVQG